MTLNTGSERFSKYPLVQLIDLTLQCARGDNAKLVSQIAKRLPCQVGGGISSIERAKVVLDAGARRVIVGSSLFEEIDGVGSVNTAFAADLAQAIGLEKIVAGVDARGGQIAIKGWKAKLTLSPEEAIPSLEAHVGAYLYTHIDGEGLMQGFPIQSPLAFER